MCIVFSEDERLPQQGIQLLCQPCATTHYVLFNCIRLEMNRLHLSCSKHCTSNPSLEAKVKLRTTIYNCKGKFQVDYSQGEMRKYTTISRNPLVGHYWSNLGLQKRETCAYHTTFITIPNIRILTFTSQSLASNNCFAPLVQLCQLFVR